MKKSLIVFLKIAIIISTVSCTAEEAWFDSSIDVDAGLPIDSNGYYHLVLDKTQKKTIHTLKGRVLNSPAMVGKPIDFLLTNGIDSIYVSPEEVKPDNNLNFKTHIIADSRMSKDTLKLRSRVFVGIDAVGEKRYATNFTNIIIK
jgi:hypothetical protein